MEGSSSAQINKLQKKKAARNVLCSGAAREGGDTNKEFQRRSLHNVDRLVGWERGVKITRRNNGNGDRALGESE